MNFITDEQKKLTAEEKERLPHREKGFLCDLSN
jgi:hypothetical protein